MTALYSKPAAAPSDRPNKQNNIIITKTAARRQNQQEGKMSDVPGCAEFCPAFSLSATLIGLGAGVLSAVASLPGAPVSGCFPTGTQTFQQPRRRVVALPEPSTMASAPANDTMRPSSHQYGILPL